MEHGEAVANAVIDVDDAGLQKLAAAEGEQLAGDFGGTRGCCRMSRAWIRMAAGSGVLQGQLAGEADGLGDVVEVVSDAAGEASDGFHAMGVVELLFEFALAGDVADIGLDVLVPGFGVGAERAGDGDAEQTAVLLAQAGFEIAEACRGEQFCEIAVALGEIGKERCRVEGDELLKGVAEKVEQGGIGVLVSGGW